MIEPRKGWLSGMLTSLEDAKIQTGPPSPNVVPLSPQQLSKLHDQARRCLSELASIHAEGHALIMREQEARERLMTLQKQIIEAVSEVRIMGTIVELPNV